MNGGSLLRQLSLPTSWGDLTIAGGSRAGDGTLILLPQLQLALDAGRPHRALPAMNTVVVSHGHVDHLGGLAYWASQRQLQNMAAARLYAPAAIATEIDHVLAAFARLEGGDRYGVEVEGVADGERRAVRKDMDLEFFATDHWVPTLGTSLFWTRRCLRAELSHLAGHEIADRRRRGERITDSVENHLLAYCADSGPGVLDLGERVLHAEVVLVECSFYRPADHERARRFGHMHLDDLLGRSTVFACRHLVLLHASRRHRLREVEAIINDRIRPAFECSVHHLMVDWD